MEINQRGEGGFPSRGLSISKVLEVRNSARSSEIVQSA